MYEKSATCWSSYYHLRALKHIRSSLPDDVCTTIATAMVQPRLDYANSILYGILSVTLIHWNVYKCSCQDGYAPLKITRLCRPSQFALASQ